MIKLTDELFEKIANTVPVDVFEKLMKDCSKQKPNTDEHKMVLIQKVVNEYLPDVKFSVDDNSDDIIV
jgi:ribosomal protein S12